MLSRTFVVLKNVMKNRPVILPIRFILVILEIVALFVNLISPKWIFLALQSGKFPKVIVVIGLIFFFNTICALFNRITYIFLRIKSEELNIMILDSFLRKTSSNSILNYYSERYYDDYSLVFEKICDIHNMTIDNILNFLKIILSITVTTVILFWAEPLIIIILVLFIVVNAIIQRIKNKFDFKYNEINISNTRKLQYIYNFFILPKYIRDLKLKEYKDYVFGKKERYSDSYIEDYKVNIKPIVNLDFLSNFFSQCENFFVLLYFSYKMFTKVLRVEDFFICLNAYNSLKNAITGIIQIYNSFCLMDLYIKKFFEVEGKNNEDGRKLLEENIDTITIKDVTFSYFKDGKNILNNININMKKGDKILITGSNGKGKTTLVQLILGLIQPDEGVIFFNENKNINTRLINPEQKISILFQDSCMYPFTVEENITLSNAKLRDKISELIEKLDFKDVEVKLPEYITGQFSEKGRELSGGEAQYIALLRALIAEKTVLILDEPFNNLDGDKAKKLVDYLNKEDEKIIILISHFKTGYNFNYELKL